MRVVFLSMSLAAVMSFMTACSSSKCESVCEEANACELTERPTNVDCPRFCEDAEAFNRMVEQYNLMITYPDGLDRERLTRRPTVADAK